MVIWITGLANAGKTTIGTHVHRLWKARAPNTVFVDGGDVRRILGVEVGDSHFTIEARRAVAERISEICAWLDAQDLNVVCCTISPFPEVQAKNRATFTRYFEVFITAPLDVLRRRDSKELYSRASRGEISNVFGVDIPFEAPRNPDLVIDNATDRPDLEVLADEILRKAGVR